MLLLIVEPGHGGGNNMNLSEASSIVYLKGRERVVKKDMRDYRDRIDFLTRWVRKYGEELELIKPLYNKARAVVKGLPGESDFSEALKVLKENEELDKEIKKLRKRKEKCHGKR